MGRGSSSLLELVDRRAGGPETLGDWVKESVGKEQGWIGAFLDEKLVGLAILRADSYGPGQARFNGAYALPKVPWPRSWVSVDERHDSGSATAAPEGDEGLHTRLP